MKRRIKPEPSFRWKICFHEHIGNQKAVHENLTFDVQSEHRSDRTARAIADNQPVSFYLITAIRCLDGQADVIIMRLNGHHLVFPAQRHARFLRALDHVFFQVVLLQVDHARALVAGLRPKIEIEYFLITEECAADIPAHTLADNRITAAKPVKNFQRALGIAETP